MMLGLIWGAGSVPAACVPPVIGGRLSTARESETRLEITRSNRNMLSSGLVGFRASLCSTTIGAGR